jgi:hypothetical protein
MERWRLLHFWSGVLLCLKQQHDKCFFLLRHTHAEHMLRGIQERPVCQALVWCCYEIWMLLCQHWVCIWGTLPAVSCTEFRYVVSWRCFHAACFLSPFAVSAFREVTGKGYIMFSRYLLYLPEDLGRGQPVSHNPHNHLWQAVHLGLPPEYPHSHSIRALWDMFGSLMFAFCRSRLFEKQNFIQCKSKYFQTTWIFPTVSQKVICESGSHPTCWFWCAFPKWFYSTLGKKYFSPVPVAQHGQNRTGQWLWSLLPNSWVDRLLLWEFCDMCIFAHLRIWDDLN